MGWFDWFDGSTSWRILNAAFAAHGLFLLGVVMKDHWAKSDESVRFLMQALGFFLLATIIASVESVIQDNPIGLRTTLFTVAALFASLGLSGYKKKTKPEGPDRT